MQQEKNDWYAIENLDRLDSPALVIYPDRVRANIRTAVNMVGGDTSLLRPHIKTHKSPDVTRLLQEAGIHKFKCATIAEAELLALCKARDVLLAYQPVGPKLDRFLSLIRHYPDTRFSCLIDAEESARQMGAVFSAAGLQVPVYLDLNIGMNRTGIQPEMAGLDLYQIASGIGGITPVGLHAYDGHIRDANFAARTEHCDKAFARVSALKEALARQGFPTPVIVAGGSPTFSIHCKRQGIECSPGTFIYWDKGYMELCPEQSFVPAALVLTRIVSLPAPDQLCLDLGHKSIAAENQLSRRVFFLNAPELTLLGQSEEHLVVSAGADHSYKMGDVLYGLPIHICPTIALYERAYTIENGRFSGQWMTRARDRKINW